MKDVLLVAVPFGVVTVIVPVVAPADSTAVMVVEFTTENDDALVPLNFTAVAPVKFVPVKVIVAPLPEQAPNGLKLVSVGAAKSIFRVGCLTAAGEDCPLVLARVLVAGKLAAVLTIPSAEFATYAPIVPLFSYPHEISDDCPVV